MFPPSLEWAGSNESTFKLQGWDHISITLVLDCEEWVTVVHHVSDQLVEQEFREKEKLVEGLKDTVDKQKKDLNIVQKEIMKKDMLCSALKVSNVV